MFIAIPTNDRVNIEQKSGRAKEFVILELENNENIKYVKNPHSHNHNDSHSEAHHEHSHQSMIDMFNENNVEALIVDVVGKHFKKDLFDANMNIYKTNLKNLEEIAKVFSEDSSSFTKILG